MRSGWLVAGWVAASAVRRLSRRTGVTDAEAFGSLPGDDVIAHPMVEWTRGVLERLDALMFAAPVFWQVTRYLWVIRADV